MILKKEQEILHVFKYTINLFKFPIQKILFVGRLLIRLVYGVGQIERHVVYAPAYTGEIPSECVYRFVHGRNERCKIL